jgi:hypothetical protein
LDAAYYVYRGFRAQRAADPHLMLSRLALGGATAVCASVAAVFATTQDVESCPVPEGSLLDFSSQTQDVWYSDCFRTSVSPGALRSVGRTSATDAFMKAFFRYAHIIGRSNSDYSLFLTGIETHGTEIMSKHHSTKKDPGECAVLAFLSCLGGEKYVLC